MSRQVSATGSKEHELASISGTRPGDAGVGHIATRIRRETTGDWDDSGTRIPPVPGLADVDC
jgi:hypothetical protein